MANITKYTLAEQAIRILQGGNYSDDNNIDLREVALFVDQAYSSIARRRLFNEREASSEWINGSYIYTFKNIEVLEDTDLDQYYIIIPATTFDLPNDSGIQYVGYMKNQKDTILPVPNTFCSLFGNTIAARLQGNAGYYVEGGKIYFVNWDTKASCKILLKMLVASLDSEVNGFAIDECNTASIPLDMQEEILKRTVELYKLEKVVDKDVTNDNIDG